MEGHILRRQNRGFRQQLADAIQESLVSVAKLSQKGTIRIHGMPLLRLFSTPILLAEVVKSHLPTRDG